MKVTTSCEIRCTQCRKWFRSQIVQFEDAETFLHTVIYKNSEVCPYCDTMVSHDKEIMRFLEKDSTGKAIKETRCIYNF